LWAGSRDGTALFAEYQFFDPPAQDHELVLFDATTGNSYDLGRYSLLRNFFPDPDTGVLVLPSTGGGLLRDDGTLLYFLSDSTGATVLELWWGPAAGTRA